MIITLPAEITVTGETECAELTIHRPSIMVESRTPTLVPIRSYVGTMTA